MCYCCTLCNECGRADEMNGQLGRRKCPGCGVTGLCLDLLHGRFTPSYNWGLVLAAPWGLFLIWAEKTGRHPGAVRALTWVLAAALLAWGVLRNLWGL